MTENSNLNRRNFLRDLTVGAIGTAALLTEIKAEAQNAAMPAEQLGGPPVNIAVIGLGPRGREILTSLAKIGPAANVVTLCDKFATPVFTKRASEIAPKATVVADYKAVLTDPKVQGVFIATPTHLHKQIALDAIAAGKHVYCEAPLAHTINDAKAIALAAKGSKVVFQSGLQSRCNAQALHVGKFVHSGALGKPTSARAQWHNKTTWRFANPATDREAELNWRLKKDLSTGIAGEIGIHQIDTATYYLKAKPLSVTGFGGIVLYKDGREVPDTIQLVVEYPNGVRLSYDATLTNSFDGAYELFQGSDSAIMLRDQRAWMFKEADANQLGWEVFARKDDMAIGNVEAGSGVKLGIGIALVADASKQLALGKQPGEVGTDVTKTALYQAVVGFVKSCQKGERVFAKEPAKTETNPPIVPGPVEGYEATVVAIKANEAVMTGSKITLAPELFAL